MILIEVFKAIILGVIEGITEWLPISSTGHMILANEFIKLNMTEAFKEMFFVVVQLGAIMSVVVLYFNKLNPFSLKKSNVEKRETIDLWLKVIVGVLPAVIIGGLFDDILNSMFYNYQIVSITLILYGVLFIVIENRNKNKEPKIKEFSHLTYKTSILIGMFQVLALIPGTSRSGATIIGAMLLGTSRYIATEYTFFLAIPIMFGASVLKLLKFGLTFNTLEVLVLGSGMATAYVVSILSIKFLVGYIKKNDFKAFGYYRIALGIVVILWFMLKF